MAYCSQADLEKFITSDTLKDLTDDNVSGSIDSDKVTQAIVFADSIINGYLRPRFDVPVESPPDVLKDLSVMISAYKLYSRRANVYGGIPEWIQMQHAEAIEMLKEIRKGNMHLDVDPQPADSQHQMAMASSDPSQYFTDDNLENW